MLEVLAPIVASLSAAMSAIALNALATRLRRIRERDNRLYQEAKESVVGAAEIPEIRDRLLSNPELPDDFRQAILAGRSVDDDLASTPEVARRRGEDSGSAAVAEVAASAIADNAAAAGTTSKGRWEIGKILAWLIPSLITAGSAVTVAVVNVTRTDPIDCIAYASSLSALVTSDSARVMNAESLDALYGETTITSCGSSENLLRALAGEPPPGPESG